MASQDRPAKRPRRESASGDGSAIVNFDISGAACHYCHARKVKCGGELPTCAGCSKANVRCMVYDPNAPQAYAREDFQELYNKAKALEKELLAATSPQSGNSGPDQSERTSARPCPRGSSPSSKKFRTGTQTRLNRRAPTENRFVGQDSAVSFLLPRIQPSRSRGLATAQAERSEVQTPRMMYHAPHPFPPRETALMAVRDYFLHHYPAQPVLDPEVIYNALDKYTLASGVQPTIAATELFRLFMALAIGSICLFRAGTFEPHPFGYFTAALEVWTPSMSSFNTIEDIEHFLLIAQFGFYYDIGCSIWELGRLSMRTAVELGLHCLAVDSPSSNRSRRVFWMAYMLDRSSSYTLGRPFAIGDQSITTQLPDTVSSLDAHNWRIGLSQLTSRMRCGLRSKRGPVIKDSFPTSQQTLQTESLDFSSTVALLRRFNNQLQEWRRKAPHHPNPTCIAESPQYLDLLYHEARLGLLRAASDKLVVSPSPLPKSLLRLSLSAACKVISTFETLRQSNMLICTRAEAHLIFVTSLVVLSLIQALEGLDEEASEDNDMDGDDDPWFDFLEDESFPSITVNVADTISTASRLLSWLCDALPDFAICARIFEETRRSLGPERYAGPQIGEDPRRAGMHMRAESAVLGGEVGNENSASQSWLPMTDDGAARFHLDQGITDPHGHMFDGSALAIAGAAPSFDLTTALLSEGFGVPAAPGLESMHWPLSNFEGMAAIDACFSGYVWDQNVPWEGSPSMTMDSV